MNHKIQMRPTSIPNGLIAEVGASSIENSSIAALNSIDCPRGTVPIRRTRKEDLLRAKSFRATNIHPQSADFPGQHLAILRSKNQENIKYKGVQGYISLQSLKLEAEQTSSSQMWIDNGPFEQVDTLQAGWIVSPKLFSDNNTRLFGYWGILHGNRKGCVNTFCLGFVQVDNNYPVGSTLSPTSQYLGKQYTIFVQLFQDAVTGHWWLRANDSYVGYWPKPLLPNLVDGASLVAWGGSTKGSPDINKKSAPMGNGHFPGASLSRAGYFRQIQIVNASNYMVNPKQDNVETLVLCPKAYGIRYYGYRKVLDGHLFLFGGPGNYCGL